MVRGNKKNNKKRRKKNGPKSAYSSQKMDMRAYKLSLLGLTNEELAIAFGVSIQTIEKYIRMYPSFANAVRRGKQEADSEVAHSLFRSAKGYNHPDIKYFKNKVIHHNEKGLPIKTEDEIIKVPTTKHYPPNPTSAIYWMNNRTRGQEHAWSNATRFEFTGKDGGPIKMQERAEKLQKLNNDEVDLLKSIMEKTEETMKN